MDAPLWGLTNDVLTVWNSDVCSESGDMCSGQGDLVAAEMREGYAAARQAVRRAAGIRMLLGLLHARSSMPAGQVDRLRALAVRCLLGLAHEPQLRHILAKLQVCTLSWAKMTTIDTWGGHG